MSAHIKQAEHNRSFLTCIEREFNADFFDWKITVIFYEALHLLKAYGESKRINIGNSHIEINRNIHFKYGNKLKLNQQTYKSYIRLYQYSRTARYDGITDIASFQKMKEADYTNALLDIDYLRKFLKGKGIS